MAKISSHLLNAADGTHAGGVPITLTGPDGALFESQTDPGGRLVEDIAADRIDPGATYEMVFKTAGYWKDREIPRGGPQIMSEIVLRITMPDPDGAYHLPIILSPNGYSMWWSA